MFRRRPQREFVLTLPLRRVNRVLRCLGFVVGCLLLAAASLAVWGPGWFRLGALLAWCGLMAIFLSVYRSWRRVSKRRSSCVVSCLSVCLDFGGSPWAVEDLETELRLNEHAPGTLIQNLLAFPGNHGIACQMFAAGTNSILDAHLRKHRSPLIALIPRPILMEPNFWAIVLFPLQAIRSWLKRRLPNDTDHAVIIYGVIDDRVVVFDPAFSTTHTVKFSWLAQRLIPFVRGSSMNHWKLLGLGP